MKLIKKLLLNEMSTSELKELSFGQMADLAIEMELMDKLDTMGVDYHEDFDVVVEMIESTIEGM